MSFLAFPWVVGNYRELPCTSLCKCSFSPSWLGGELGFLGGRGRKGSGAPHGAEGGAGAGSCPQGDAL